MVMEKSASTSKAFPFSGEVRRAIISALVVDPKRCNWAIEMKMTKNLLKKYPEPDFWLFISRSFKFQSLMSLVSQKDIINSQYLEYTKQKDLEFKTPPVIKLTEKNLGEDIIIKQSKQSLIDFIR